MGKSLIQPPIKINFYYGRYLSSGRVMDGPAFTPWQDDGLWMPAAPCWGGGVAASNADTRVITALLTTATEGCREGVRAVRWGEHMYLHRTGGSNKGRN